MILVAPTKATLPKNLKNEKNKSNNAEGKVPRIYLDPVFTSDSTKENTPSMTNVGPQIKMHCPYVLVIYLKGQMLNSNI